MTIWNNEPTLKNERLATSFRLLDSKSKKIYIFTNVSAMKSKEELIMRILTVIWSCLFQYFLSYRRKCSISILKVQGNFMQIYTYVY